MIVTFKMFGRPNKSDFTAICKPSFLLINLNILSTLKALKSSWSTVMLRTEHSIIKKSSLFHWFLRYDAVPL